MPYDKETRDALQAYYETHDFTGSIPAFDDKNYTPAQLKLRVFISSKCGGKYTIARKSLQKLLEVTGLVETYVFETDPASSEDTQSAYLEYVDGSNLCVFLVDNEDGVPPAVLSEEKRAKDKHYLTSYTQPIHRTRIPLYSLYK